MATTTEPNFFRLSGGGVDVTYSTTSIDGTPRFTFEKGRLTLNFSGNEITRTSIGIGTLVSVVIANVPDKGVTTFSVLLPAIRLARKRQAFRTIGITTVSKTTIVGPPPGVQQTYKIVALRGSAQHVAF
jgi:hypothetical protein